MWNKLLSLLKDKTVTDDIKSAVPQIELQQEVNPSMLAGRSTHLGYNYLKGLDGENEDNTRNNRRFINLNRLLRGNYDGKVASTHAEPQKNLRGENSE